MEVEMEVEEMREALPLLQHRTFWQVFSVFPQQMFRPD